MPLVEFREGVRQGARRHKHCFTERPRRRCSISKDKPRIKVVENVAAASRSQDEIHRVRAVAGQGLHDEVVKLVSWLPDCFPPLVSFIDGIYLVLGVAVAESVGVFGQSRYQLLGVVTEEELFQLSGIVDPALATLIVYPRGIHFSTLGKKVIVGGDRPETEPGHRSCPRIRDDVGILRPMIPIATNRCGKTGLAGP